MCDSQGNYDGFEVQPRLPPGDIGIGATIRGQIVFGRVRVEWGSADWNGRWGDNPAFHHPVFVLSHHPQPTIAMDGGATF